MCPSDSECVNFIGSYKCDCGLGRTLVKNECRRVDYCATEFNMCDSVCTSSEQAAVCSCHAGYELTDDKRTCRKSSKSELFAGCESLGCTQMCSRDDDKNKAVCRCHKGYRLDKDGKTCLSKIENFITSFQF